MTLAFLYAHLLQTNPFLYHCKDFPETLEVPIRGRVCFLTLELGEEAGAKQKKLTPKLALKVVSEIANNVYSEG